MTGTNADGTIRIKPEIDNHWRQEIFTRIAVYTNFEIVAVVTNDIHIRMEDSDYEEDKLLAELRQIEPLINKCEIGFRDADDKAWRIVLENGDYCVYDEIRFYECDLPLCNHAMCVFCKAGRCRSILINGTPPIHNELGCNTFCTNN